MAGRVTTSEEERTTTDFRCVQCGFPVKTLYIQYSPGNIRLGKCVILHFRWLIQILLLLFDLIS